MFKDKIKIHFKAGDGGKGGVFFEKRTQRPAGGIGGDGGSVYLVGDSHEYDFQKLKNDQLYRAEDGENGKAKNQYGANGKDKFIKVPLMTIVFNEFGEEVARVTKPNEKVKILEGGQGGLGNYAFKKGSWETRTKYTEGKAGEELPDANLMLELQSDVIFIGYPNAGKSSILKSITNAEAKVAAYAFTTINPQLGRVNDTILMDLPGLIEGTHDGRGVGTKFLKHTKSAKYLAHFLSLEDLNSENLDFESILKKYNSMRDELKEIDENLAQKQEVIVLTKSDSLEKEDRQKALEFFKKELEKPTIVTSIYDFDALEKLKEFFTELV